MLFGGVNQALIDWPWSMVHLLSGAAIGFGLSNIASRQSKKQRRIIGISLLIVWEIFENTLAVNGLVERESLLNIFGDVAVGTVGLLIFLR